MVLLVVTVGVDILGMGRSQEAGDGMHGPLGHLAESPVPLLLLVCWPPLPHTHPPLQRISESACELVSCSAGYTCVSLGTVFMQDCTDVLHGASHTEIVLI